MNKILNLDLHLLRNGEYYEFMYEFRRSISDYTCETLGLADKYPLFDALFSNLEAAIRAEQGSRKTVTIKASNQKRDRIWKAMRYRIVSAVMSPFPEEVKSGEIIKRLFDSYGYLPRKTAMAKSGSLLSLTEELLNAENAHHLEVVNLTAMANELKKENDNYLAAMNDRNAELAGRTKRQAGRKRAELDPVYHQMVGSINATLTLNLAQPEAATFVKEHNTRIKNYKTSLAARKTWRKKARQEKANTPVETPNLGVSNLDVS